MARRLTNLALLVLLAVAFSTGVAAYALGTGWAAWVVVAHGIAGLAIVLLVPWKTPIARSGLRHHQTGGWPSVALAVLVAATVLVGVLHSTGLWHDTGMWAPLNVHVWLAVAAIPLALWHVVARPVRPVHDRYQ